LGALGQVFDTVEDRVNFHGVQHSQAIEVYSGLVRPDEQASRLLSGRGDLTVAPKF
jgi:hypothetical protein